MTRIASITTSRADVGILRPVWQALSERGADLALFATGMHQRADAPPLDDLPDGAVLHRGGEDIGGADSRACGQAMGRIMSATAEFLAEAHPDLVLVIGDRLDMFPAAAATAAFNLPLAHLHGGEITEGAVDDRLRHAISKLAHIHCVSSPDARDLLLSFNEEAWRITITGAPGLDSLVAAPDLDLNAFCAAVRQRSRKGRFAATEGFILACVHPETNSAAPQAPAEALLSALHGVDMPILFTAPNSDPGGAEISDRIDEFVAANPLADYVDTLGTTLYANALRNASVLAGNSSSGILEAGLFGLPVIDVGRRQEGRTRGPNVQACAADAAAVGTLLRQILNRRQRHDPWHFYGDGHAGPAIADALLNALRADALLIKSVAAGISGADGHSKTRNF